MNELPGVVFALRLVDGAYLEEPAFASKADAVAASLSAEIEPYGRLMIRGGGQPQVMFADDLLPLADQLTAALPALRAGKNCTLDAFSQPWRLALNYDGTLLRCADEGGAARRDPASLLVPALAAAAGRLVRLLRSGRLRRPGANALLEKLTQDLG